jgi:hypothetical protein
MNELLGKHKQLSSLFVTPVLVQHQDGVGAMLAYADAGVNGEAFHKLHLAHCTQERREQLVVEVVALPLLAALHELERKVRGALVRCCRCCVLLLELQLRAPAPSPPPPAPTAAASCFLPCWCLPCLDAAPHALTTTRPHRRRRA